MTQSAGRRTLTVDAYLAGEDGSDVRHEYIAGQVYAMTGANRAHALITVNIATALRPLVCGTGCQLFANDMKLRLRVGGEDVFYYPDLPSSCDPTDREVYYCARPCLVVEELSESTERIDRGEKLPAHQSIAGLQEYLLVAQDRREVQVHRRARAWAAEVVTDGAVRFDCLGYDMPLATINEEVVPGGDACP